jgi:predicted SprT family Zn-dependent metalloprotease
MVSTCDGSRVSSLNATDRDIDLNCPHPDIHALFLHFNQKYFQSRLDGIEVKWSKRMTLCAGLCVYDCGFISVRLSEPLLQFRTTQETIETLLHEMIHAFLFVTAQTQDHDAHGPMFQAYMTRINALAGTNITMYHSFTDEVDYYRTHVWKCTGPCQTRPPYYGLVKRAMNRAPGPNDMWWEDHKAQCDGSYHKIAEPYVSSAKGNKAKKTEDKTRKIDEFFMTRTELASHAELPKRKALTDPSSKDREVPSPVQLACPVCGVLTTSLEGLNLHLNDCLL